MKKGFLKAAAASLALIPAMGLLTACDWFGGKKDNAETQTTSAQLEERYGILKTAMGKMAAKGSYTSTNISEESNKTTTTASLLTNNTWADQEAEVENNTEKTKEISTLDSTTGQYANVEYEWVVNPTTNQGSWERVNGKEDEFVVKVGTGDATKYVRYFSEDVYDWQTGNSTPTKMAEYVSPDHAQHVYGIDASMEEMKKMLSDEGYEEALENLKMLGQLASMPLSMGLSMAGFDVNNGFNTTFDTKFDIKKNGNSYSLEAELTLNLVEKTAENETTPISAAAPGVTLVFNQAYVTSKFNIDFNSNELTKITSESSSYMDISTETSETKSHVVNESAENSEVNITYSYTSSAMPTTFAEYPQEDIENSEVEVEYYLNGEELYGLGDSYVWGTDVTDNVKQEVPTIDIEHATNDGWYYDEACTRKVGENDTFNFKSWETPKFYAKTKVDAGYAVVVEKYGELHEYEGGYSYFSQLHTYVDWDYIQLENVIVLQVGTDEYSLPTQATMDAYLETYGKNGQYTLDKFVDKDNNALTSLTPADGGYYEVKVCVAAQNNA